MQNFESTTCTLMKNEFSGNLKNEKHNPNKQQYLYVGFLPHIQTYIASKKWKYGGQTALVACSSEVHIPFVFVLDECIPPRLTI